MDNTGKVKVSIIIPAKNETTNVKMTVDSIVDNSSGTIPYEVIVIDDGSEDTCCKFLGDNEVYWQEKGIRLITTGGIGLANAKNLGAENALGDIIVFSDAHVLVEKGWLEKLVTTMSRPGVDVLTPAIADYNNPSAVGYGQTWNEKLEIVWLPAPQVVVPIPLAPGGFEAVKKDTFQTVGGFDRGFKIWGYEDTEFSFKCWLFGFGVYATPEFVVQHVFRSRHTYYISFNEVNYNLLRMAISHFGRERLAKTIEMIKPMPNLENTLTEIILSDAREQREDYFNRRKYDDNWFFQKFRIPY